MLVEKYNTMNKENGNPKLDRYFQTKTMRYLEGKGLFCGMDFVNIKELKPVEYCSKLDHSRNISYTASKLSNEFKIALAGALHDVGTLSFSHVNSYKKGEGLTQQNDELDIKTILLKDEELLTYLHEDGVNIDEVVDYSKYPLIDKEIPCLCLDRADGILSTCLFWAHTHPFEEIEELYNMLCYTENLNGMCVDMISPRFQNFKGEVFINENEWSTDYEAFFRAINVYSKKLLSKESRYMMEILGLTLRYYEDVGIIDEQILFQLSEKEIIARILDSRYKDVWIDVTTFDKVVYTTNLEQGLSMVSKPKLRQANPLVLGQMALCEIDNISGDFYRELNNLYEDIALLEKPITGNLSKETEKVLSKYKK